MGAPKSKAKPGELAFLWTLLLLVLLSVFATAYIAVKTYAAGQWSASMGALFLMACEIAVGWALVNHIDRRESAYAGTDNDPA